ncbi:MAG: hypothetical protein A2Y25_04675 [Candidatus Melainabacteria bacterium GWF2_37_15]|nr:MAG: hypothetical protein A2Y25_04675 [Candidatus Melainabacteria bacterium GWF2_37_15]
MKHISKGAVHLHSIYSDGTGTIEEIAKDAKKAGLDWIIITDHNTLSSLHNGEEGWYDGVAVIIGNEISPDNCNHYLALGISEEIPVDLPSEEIIKNVKSQGGIGFIAHPDESTTRKNKYRPLRWQDWTIRGFNGLEIWNFTSDWIDHYNARVSVYCALARHKIIKGPTPNTMKWWDELNNETPEIITAIGGLDTHAFNFGFFKIFPYHDTFKTITNYLYLDKKLSQDINEAKKQVLDALKSGSNIIVNRIWNKNSNDDLSFTINEHKELFINLPQKAKIKLFRNGDLILEKKAKTLEFKGLLPGKYRFEAYHKNRPWIFSNPVMFQ